MLATGIRNSPSQVCVNCSSLGTNLLTDHADLITLLANSNIVVTISTLQVIPE